MTRCKQISLYERSFSQTQRVVFNLAMFRIAIVMLTACSFAGSAIGQTWSGTLNGTTESWNVGTNWSGGSFPNAIGAAVNINVDISANKIVSLQQAITVGSLTLGDSSGTSSLTINSGTGTNALTFDNTSGNANITSSGGSNTISAGMSFVDNVTVSNSSALTLSGVISGSGAIEKAATSGSLTLSGNNTGWSGGISHQQGTVNIQGSSNSVLGTGTVTFANQSGGSGNTIALNRASTTTLANNFVNNNQASVTGIQYAQIQFSGGTTGNRQLVLNGTFSTGANYNNANSNPQAILFDATGTGNQVDEGTIVLNGSWSGYNATGTANAASIRIQEGTLLINSQNAIANAGGYQFLGNSGATSTKLILGGEYTMNNAVQFAGGSGGLQNSFGSRNAASTTATLAGNLSLSDSDGANVFSQTSGANLRIGGVISGSNALNVNNGYTMTTGDVANSLQTPTGTVILTAANSYSGGTTVSGGTLLVNNTSGSGLGSGSVVVQSGATLGGSGSFSGSLSVSSGATLAPGASIQSLGSGAVSLASGATYAYEMNNDASAATAGDLLAVTGNLTINSGSILTLADLGGGAWADGEKLTLISYTGSWNGGLFNYLGSSLADDSTFNFGGISWLFNYNDTIAGANFLSEADGSFVTMTAGITAVPEPSAIIFGIVGSLSAAQLMRKRRSIASASA
jgi:autotransporter-associated beta strand protein